MDAEREPGTRGRPLMPPGYQVDPDDLERTLPWELVAGALAHERSYWLATTRGDGRPHQAIVWGVWDGNLFWFSTDPRSVKGANIAEQPAVSIAALTRDGLAIVLQGAAARQLDCPEAQALLRLYEAKYGAGMCPDLHNPAHGLYAVAPTCIHAWTEDIAGTATAWRW